MAPTYPRVADQSRTIDGTGTYARLAGPLGGWKAKVVSDPANARVAFVGDSTSDGALSAGAIVRTLNALHTQPGEALYGVASTDRFTDGVGNGTTTFTSATAAFTSADIGRMIHGKNIPAGTKVALVTNGTTVVLTNSVTAGTSLKFWLARHVIAGGNNGMDLATWFANPAGAYPYNRGQLVTDNPALTVYSWLINDIRTGGMGLTEDAIVPVAIARLQALIDWHRANLTGDILLRIPNPFLTANVGANNYVTDGTNTNPAGLAQIYSTALRRAYLYFVGRYPNVDVLDIQAEVFGTICAASHPLMTDQLHPSSTAGVDVSTLTPRGGGYPTIADAIAARIGFARNGFSPKAQRVLAEFVVYDAPAAGQIRLISRDWYALPAQQAPVFLGGSLYVQGLDSPISLSAATVDRTFSSTVITITGLSSTDFAPYIGNTAAVVGSYAPQTTGDRQIVTIDLPSIAAGATVTQNVTVTGLKNGSLGVGTAVLVAPGSSFLGSGLLLFGAYVNSTDTARLVINNPTGSPIDVAADNWTFFVVR